MEAIQHAWIVREAQRLANSYAEIRASHPRGITSASIVWMMERSEARARLFEGPDRPIPSWRFWDGESETYQTVESSIPPFMHAFLQRGTFTRVGKAKEDASGTLMEGSAFARGSVSTIPFPASWKWKTLCLINHFEDKFPLKRDVRLVVELIKADAQFAEALSRFGIANESPHLCPNIWTSFLTLVSEFNLIPAENYIRCQMFAVRVEKGWILYSHYLDDGSWDLVTTSCEGKSNTVMRPKWDIDNGNVWVAASWEDYFKVCEMACLWIATTPIDGWKKFEKPQGVALNHFLADHRLADNPRSAEPKVTDASDEQDEIQHDSEFEGVAGGTVPEVPPVYERLPKKFLKQVVGKLRGGGSVDTKTLIPALIARGVRLDPDYDTSSRVFDLPVDVSTLGGLPAIADNESRASELRKWLQSSANKKGRSTARLETTRGTTRGEH